MSPPTDLTPHRVLTAALTEGQVHLPAMPRIAQQVMVSAQDPDRGVAEISRLIERDPALCARVLRAANSSRFGTSVAIVSARQAVGRVGMGEVATLAMSAAVHGAFIEKGPFETAMTQWWHRSLATGFYAKEIARRRRQSVDSAFLCGLLCDVGVPVVLRILAKANVLLRPDEILRLIEDFRTRAGLALCASWTLSDAIQAAIAGLHSHDEPTAFPDQVHTARLATLFSHALAFAEGETPPAVNESPSAVALNLYPEDVEHLVGLAPNIAAMVGDLA